MSLVVWGMGITGLVITWGLGRMITPAQEELYEEDVPEEVQVTITPIPDEIQFEERIE